MKKLLAGLGIATLGGALALTGALTASAHTPALTCSDGTAHLTLAAYPAGSTVTGSLDGVSLGSTTFGPATFTAAQPIDLTVEHHYDVVVHGADGQGNQHYTGSTSTLCGIPIVPPVTETPTPEPSTPPVTETPTPEPTEPALQPVGQVLPPQFPDICGTADDAVQVPDDTATVTYTVADHRAHGVGEVIVTAHAADGFILTEQGATTLTWSHEYTDETCASTPVTPPATAEPSAPATEPAPTDATTPPASSTPAPSASTPTAPSRTDTPSTSTRSARASAAPVAADTSHADGLAYTGTDPLATGRALAGAGMLLAGGIFATIVAARRRRRANR